MIAVSDCQQFSTTITKQKLLFENDTDVTIKILNESRNSKKKQNVLTENNEERVSLEYSL